MSYSIFDIAGPIMVGPSSSHTAGAVKLGQLARAIFHKTPKKVTFELHGSFADVTEGHATDRALLGGVMKFKTSDMRIKDAFKIADKKEIKYKYKNVDLGEDAHPNSVKIILEKDDYKKEIIGSSIGGGNVEISQINEFKVNIHAVAGKYKSLIISHEAGHKAVDELVKRLRKAGFRLAWLQTVQINGKAMTIMNLESKDLNLKDVEKLERMPGIHFVRSLTKLKHD